MQTELNPELPTVGGFEDTERDMLEAWLGAECRCQMKHAAVVCSYIPIAVVSGCQKVVPACCNAVVHKTQYMADGRLCGGCDRKAADCWRIIPI